MRKLAETPIEARSFAQWSMAFGEVPAAEFQVLRNVAEYQTPAQLAGQLATGKAAAALLPDKLKVLVHPQEDGQLDLCSAAKAAF